MEPTRKATSIDVAIGQRLRRERIERGWSQSRLGKELGISFQQVQKYENGTNRIGASRVFQIAAIMQIPISDLFQDVKGHDV